MKNGRCRMHGGASLKGTDLPQFKSGRYSKSMHDWLVGRYQNALADGERHDLRDEISLAEAKIDDLLSKMVRGESDSGWLYLREVERKVQRDRSEDNPDHMRELIRVIRQGAGEARAWNAVERWTARKQRLVESDMRVAQTKQEMVSAEEVMALVAGILDSIKRHVEDQPTRRALARDIRALGDPGGVVVPIGRAGEHTREGSEE